MSHRPVALVCAVTLGDYLLWNWSLGGGHDAVAVVSGLTLPALLAASLWLVAITAARLLARSARAAPARARHVRSRGRGRARARPDRAQAASGAPVSAPEHSFAEHEPGLPATDATLPAATAQASSSRKLAA